MSGMRNVRALRWIRPIVLSLGLLAGAAPARAQVVVDSALVIVHGRDTGGGMLLPADHWAVRAAARAEAMGLANGYLPAQRAVPLRTVQHVLTVAAVNADARGGAVESLAAGWLAQFDAEFPASALLPSSASIGYREETGRLSPAVGYTTTREDPRPLPDLSSPRLTASTGVEYGRLLLWSQGQADEDGVRFGRWEAAGLLGPVRLSVGRQPVGYGPGERGGIVFGGSTLPRFDAQTAHPIRLPGILHTLGGQATLHTFATRLGGDRHPTEPWLWGARFAFQPHSRLSFAINRGAIFGGDGQTVTAGRLFGLAVGTIRNDFANQILSFEGRWRLPTDAFVPATVYAEWAADDGAGALDEMPARTAGLWIPAIPGFPQIGVGGEYTDFPAAVTGHGPWYFHDDFPGNWARGGNPLGHPLGGEGWEAAGYGQADLFGARLRLSARGFVRERGDESYATLGGGNLFAPERVGRSRGWSVDGAYRLGPRLDARGSWYRDAGDGWRERRIEAHIVLSF